ncbi:MAG: RNA polymerase sigma factor [Flavobacteriales bacterium]
MTLELLYNAHKELVFNLALQYVQNTQDAEEITQDVFISVHRNLSQFKGESTAKTWIYRITINKSLDFIKAKKRNKRWAFLTAKSVDDHSNEVANFSHPGVELEHKEELASLFKSINQLPARQKTALILLKIEDRSQAVVAEIMELTPKAVESLFQRAKKNLEKIINQNEGK